MKEIEKYKKLPILWYKDARVLPLCDIHVGITKKVDLDLIKYAIEKYEGMVIIFYGYKEEKQELIGKVGVVAKITGVKSSKYNYFNLDAVGLEAVILENLEVLIDENAILAEFTEKEYFNNIYSNDDTKLYIKKINSLLNKIAVFDEEIPKKRISLSDEKPDEIATTLLGISKFFDEIDKEKVLNADTIGDMAAVITIGLTLELELKKLEQTISTKVTEEIMKKQKEAFLKEQIKAINEELNETEVSDDNDLFDAVTEMKASDKVKEKLMKECVKLSTINPSSAEYFVIRNYIEFCSQLPWNTCTEERIDVSKARKILDEDHYGMDEVKKRVLEFLAVRKLTGTNSGSIICFVGAPGVGKTSICQSIAKAMDKKYVRISLGGIRDEAEIRGHRRTYVASMAGRILTGLKEAGSSNPLFLLDEVDKLTSDMRGDPASALLEVLDPAQNSTFQDHYVDMPYDLSNVFFITTANSIDSIPRPLLDRMEVIEMSGYTYPEKVAIAKGHLLPKLLKKTGINAKIEIDDSTLRSIITNFTRESGVRELNRMLEKIVRKVAMEIVTAQEEQALLLEEDNLDEKIDKSKKRKTKKQRSFNICESNLEKYLGIFKYVDDNLMSENTVGVVNGLAWTAVGGEMLNMEVSLFDGKGEIILTGQLGDVMKESARIAVSYLKSNAELLGIDSKLFTTKDIHIHVPEGAVKKDGPSAGVTLITALYSIFSNKKVSCKTAMTGEITLKGNVLAIGGLKEKLLAAMRYKMSNVIIPSLNKKDLAEIPDEIKENLNILFASSVADVLSIAIV